MSSVQCPGSSAIRWCLVLVVRCCLVLAETVIVQFARRELNHNGVGFVQILWVGLGGWWVVVSPLTTKGGVCCEVLAE